ncbi:winged helix-turn-helix domain-containing protein [Clostridioides difficile]|uniref:winged helix-turn-helix domain-containing protein n=1 Tax=Clostridioides difficile TaxID=1496 RepID=UPI00097FFB06|nr:winged helix-turn-helix domain-containing protein [Clostridioides difficile]EGT3856605.1 ArsR family transcriptional regulator [Clostridioides difficile]EJA6892676.1 winged helix-turn-helix transcriptional regulator [Clostridioides difficile]EJX3382011.1 winged helix-turn-helix transcriptional regulator [Clostridioides difficile]ELX4570701.1 winged helix-turn-helix transcriptional regulator [Clostridioides difficile]MBF9881621.1 winged helix-turn-helix transcriptional regulator [Clostridioi
MVTNEEIKNESKQDYYLPMPTYCLKEKHYCVREYGALMLNSNGGSRILHTERNRFLYKNKINFQEIANELGINKTTLERNIKKLEKLDCKVLEVENTRNGIVYRLNYGLPSEYNELEVNKFITIHHEMLKEMINCFKPNVIKIYCLLRVIANENDFKSASNSFIAEGIGLSSKSKNNLDIVTSSVKLLEKLKYIEVKKDNLFKFDKEKGKEVPVLKKFYRICNFSEWKKLDNKVD